MEEVDGLCESLLPSLQLVGGDVGRRPARGVEEEDEGDADDVDERLEEAPDERVVGGIFAAEKTQVRVGIAARPFIKGEPTVRRDRKGKLLSLLA